MGFPFSKKEDISEKMLRMSTLAFNNDATRWSVCVMRPPLCPIYRGYDSVKTLSHGECLFSYRFCLWRKDSAVVRALVLEV